MAVIEVKGVTKDYLDKGSVTTHALRGVDLVVESGEFMAIAGPSGSGKTTLLNLVGALDSVTSGTIRIDGREISFLSQGELSDLRRDRIGFVFQAYNLVPVLTAAENAEYVMELQGLPSAERRRRLSELFDAHGHRGADGNASPEDERRPAAARGGRSGDRQRAGAGAGGRAHREPRSGHGPLAGRADARAEPRAWSDIRALDARPHGARAGRPRGAARRWQGRGG